MAGRTVSSAGVHEAEGVVGAGQFVAQRTAPAADALKPRHDLPAMRAEMDVFQANSHIEEAESCIRSSWASGHSGDKTGYVAEARYSLDRAIEVRAEADAKIDALEGPAARDRLRFKLDETDAEIEKLTRWYESADEKAQAAVKVVAELEAKHGKYPTAAPTGTIDNPVKHSDPRLLAGEVFDTIENEGWGTFHRRREGVYPDAPYAFRVQVDRELSPEDLSQLAKILGSAYATTGWNEGLGWPEQDTPFSFIVSADTTKGRAYRHLDTMEENLADYLVSGSPIAKTSRGRTPKGERYVEGFGENAPKLELYYDNVHIPAD